MSLSRWFRDYVYIPLGGNRGSTAATYRNLIIVFALTGLWHGANWTFLVWGLYHGALLIFERATNWNDRKSSVALRRASTMLLVAVGWVFFRSQDIPRALAMLRAMFIPSGMQLADQVSAVLTNQRSVVLALATLVVFLPPDFVLGRVLDADRSTAAHVARYTVMSVVVLYAAVLIAAGTFSPFLYFQF
jgi:alginate O-acetyltransferase complex protein AlgI